WNLYSPWRSDRGIDLYDWHISEAGAVFGLRHRCAVRGVSGTLCALSRLMGCHSHWRPPWGLGLYNYGSGSDLVGRSSANGSRVCGGSAGQEPAQMGLLKGCGASPLMRWSPTNCEHKRKCYALTVAPVARSRSYAGKVKKVSRCSDSADSADNCFASSRGSFS